MLERATDATCSLRKTDSVAKVLQSHTDTLVKVHLYKLDVAMSRLPRSMSRLYEYQRYIFDSQSSWLFSQICIKPNSKDCAASPCARFCHLSPSSRHHLSRTITSIAIHDASCDIIAVDRDELVNTLSLGNPWFETVIAFQ